MLQLVHALLMSLVAALLVLPLSAAPVPKTNEKEKIEKLFGKIVDPKKDCQFKLEKDALIVTLPANESKDFCSMVDTVPKLEKTVTGEFVLTVRVACELPEDAKPGKAADTAFLGGGVCIRGKRDEWAKFNFFTANLGTHRTSVGCESPGRITSDSGYANGIYFGKNYPAMSLRVTRTADVVHLATSPDGKTWRGIVLMPLKLQDECTVQLFAQHASDQTRTVTFSDFSITPRKVGEKADLKASIIYGDK